MITGALWVLGCQLVGEVVVRSLGIPVPGPVVGMVLLFGVLTVRRAGTGEDADGGPMAGTLRVAGGLLRHMQLLFVPVSVGIMVARDEPPRPLRRRPRVDPNFLQFVPSAHERS